MQKGLKDTSSMALETKIALIAAVYAMERLFAASGQKGTDLTNLNSLLGVSTKTLQQYEYAARQVGVSNEELDGTFKSLQSSMTKTLMGEGAPKGMARVAQLTGGISPADIKRFAEHPEDLVQKLQQYAAKEQNVGLKNEVLKSFGVSDQMIAALNRKAFRPEVLQKAPLYTDKETGQLDKANIAWSNLRNTIEMAVGHFNAKHGNELVGGISKIIPQIIKLAEAFVKLGEKLHALEWFGKAIEAWSKILGGLGTIVDAIGGDKNAQKEVGTNVSEYASGLVEVAKGGAGGGLLNSLFGVNEVKKGDTAIAGLGSGIGTPKPGTIAPVKQPSIAAKAAVPAAKSIDTKKSTTNQVNVNQTLQFNHDGKDSHKTGESVKKATKDAFRQIPAIGQGA